MLGLYLDTLIIGHEFCSILNKFTLQKEMQKKYDKVKTTTKTKHKYTCLSRELNPGPLAAL